jgi:hypothetical protein
MGLLIFYVPLKLRQPPGAAVEAAATAPGWVRLTGLIPLALGIGLLAAPTDDFQRIDDAGGGRWALHHGVRGNVAVFAGAEITSLEAVERRGRGGSNFKVRARLRDGREYSASTGSGTVVAELRKFAATAGLRPGALRIERRAGGTWTNAQAAFAAVSCAGTYEHTDPRSKERSTVEFWVKDGRLAGRETVVDGPRRHVRTLDAVKLSDTGEVEFRPSSYLEASGDKTSEKISISFSFSTGGGTGPGSGGGESGRFTQGGLEIGGKTYRRL